MNKNNWDLVCVHYEITKDGKMILSTCGWWHSIENAKKDLKHWERKGCTVKIW